MRSFSRLVSSKRPSSYTRRAARPGNTISTSQGTLLESLAERQGRSLMPVASAASASKYAAQIAQPPTVAQSRQPSPLRTPAQVGLLVKQAIQGPDCSNTAQVDRTGTGRGSKWHLICIAGTIDATDVLVVVHLSQPTWKWMSDSLVPQSPFRLRRSQDHYRLTWPDGCARWSNHLDLSLRWQTVRACYQEAVTINSVRTWQPPSQRATIVITDNAAHYSFFTNVITLNFKFRQTGPWRIEIQLTHDEMMKLHGWLVRLPGVSHNTGYKTILLELMGVICLKVEPCQGQLRELDGLYWDHASKRHLTP